MKSPLLHCITDAIDFGNNKKAIQEAERVLKKQPNLWTAKALMSVALVRIGRESEAQSILSKIQQEPCDESALNAMSIAFRELRQHDKICLMYENAAKREPQNEDILSQLFMAYVRIGDYKKQQRTAMQLYKVIGLKCHFLNLIYSQDFKVKPISMHRSLRSILLTISYGWARFLFCYKFNVHSNPVITNPDKPNSRL